MGEAERESKGVEAEDAPLYSTAESSSLASLRPEIKRAARGRTEEDDVVVEVVCTFCSVLISSPAASLAAIGWRFEIRRP